MHNNNSFLLIFLFVVAIVLTWWIRGEEKDKEYQQSAIHKIDSTKIVREIPLPIAHVEIGPLPAKIPDSDRREIDTAIVRALRVSVDSLKGLVRLIAARIDTVIRTDSSGSARFRYNPLTRMASLDLMPLPRREVEIRIRDSVVVPIVEHDSFTTRFAIASGGIILGALIQAIAR